MKLIPFSQIEEATWDSLVKESKEGWLFSTYSWQKLIENIPQWRFVNVGFGIEFQGNIIGLCPLHLAGTCLSSAIMGDGGPVFSPFLSSSTKEKAFQFFLVSSEKIAQSLGATFLELSLSPLSLTSLENSRGVNPYVIYGFEDFSTHSWLVDLSPSIDEIFGKFSRIAKRKIKEAKEAGYSVREIANRNELDLYHQIHIETYNRTGAPPFPKEYFLSIYDFVYLSGKAQTLVVENLKGVPIAFCNIGIFKNQSLYWTVCCSNDDYESGVYYLLVWAAIRAAKERGNSFFETSEAFPNAPEGSKLKGLNDFKRKFGGTLHRFIKGRFFFHKKTPNGTTGLQKSLWQTTKSFAKNVTLDLFRGKDTEALKPSLRALSQKLKWALRYFQFGHWIPFLKPFWSEKEIEYLRHPMNCPDDSVRNFEECLREYFNLPGNAFVGLTGSGRGALRVALQGLKRLSPKKKIVLLPTYCCRGVIEPIFQSGLTPRFVDISNDILSSEKDYREQLSPDVLAIIIIHTSGFTNCLEGLISTARSSGVFVIQDHCQNFQPNNPMMSPIFADINIFSFGLGKILSATAGGALVSFLNNSVFDDEYKKLKCEDQENAILRAQVCLKRFVEKISFLPSRGLEILRNSYSEVKMCSLDALILVEQLRKSAFVVQRRIENSEVLNEVVDSFPNIFSRPHSSLSIYSKYSIILQSLQLWGDFQVECFNKNIETENMYIPLHLRSEESRFRDEKFFPQSESIWRRVINLPVRPNLTSRDLARIVLFLKEFGKRNAN